MKPRFLVFGGCVGSRFRRRRCRDWDIELCLALGALFFQPLRILVPLVLLSTALAQGASITLTSPTDGESWAADSPHAISWKSETRDGEVRISFSTDAGATWSDIADRAPNSGRYLWKVPGSVSKKCRVRVGTAESGDFVIIPSQEVRGYRWEKVTMEAPFAPRDGAGAIVYNGHMWLVGGWNPDDKVHFPKITANDVWSSEDGAAWTLIKPNTFDELSFDPSKDWEGRHTAGYLVFRGKMWILGGDGNQKHYQNDVWNSTDGKTWNRVNPGQDVPWGPRVLHYTVVFGGRIWVIGGQTMPGFAPAPEAFYRDVWNSSDGIHWQKLKPAEPYWPARGLIGGHAVFRNRIWILGGGTYDTPTTPQRTYYNDVWSSPDGIHWTCHIQSAPWAPREYHDVAVFDDRLWVLEGYAEAAGGNRKDVWYSADGVNWYELPDTPWKPRHAASVFVHDHALWMVAGNNMESDVWKLVHSER